LIKFVSVIRTVITKMLPNDDHGKIIANQNYLYNTNMSYINNENKLNRFILLTVYIN
jgi:hypothetical protein